MIFLVLLLNNTGGLPSLPTAPRGGLGICVSPSARGEGWVRAGLGCCVSLGFQGPLSVFIFLVSRKDTQDFPLGLVSCFQDGCKALPMLPVLSSCLSPASSAPLQGCWLPQP